MLEQALINQLAIALDFLEEVGELVLLLVLGAQIMVRAHRTVVVQQLAQFAGDVFCHFCVHAIDFVFLVQLELGVTEIEGHLLFQVACGIAVLALIITHLVGQQHHVVCSQQLAIELEGIFAVIPGLFE